VEGSEASSSTLLLTVIIPAPVEWEGVHHLNEPSLGVIDTPGSWVTSSSKGSRSSSVVRTVAGHDLRSSSELPGHVEGSLVGLSTSRSKEETIEISRGNFSEQLRKSSSNVTRHGVTIDKGDGVDLVYDGFVH